jgi:uncharacterized protein YkwD
MNWPRPASRRITDAEAHTPDGFRAVALCALLVLQAAGASNAPAHFATAADALGAARALHSQGCEGHSGVHSALRANAALNILAARWAHGGSLQTAIEQGDYSASQSAALHVSGADVVQLRAELASHLCAALTNPAMLEIGAYQDRTDIWLVLGAPFSVPRPEQADAIAQEMLRLVNAARAAARLCGQTSMSAVGPVRLNPLLGRAAMAHAQDMLRNRYFQHLGSDGSNPAGRVAAAGYAYRLVGENIALGPQTAREVMQGWLASPEHCQNIMDPRFEELGSAYAAGGGGEPRIYWVQDFAAARARG